MVNHFIAVGLLAIATLAQSPIARANQRENTLSYKLCGHAVESAKARATAQAPHFGEPVFWDNEALWRRSQIHSNDFFTSHAWDQPSGSFASEISSDGKVLNDKRHLIATSRMIYGLAHSASEDASYLEFARTQARFLIEKMTARDRDGYYFKTVVDANGKATNTDQKLVVNYQAYGLNGLVALYKVTRAPWILEKIQTIYGQFYQRFHDPVHRGFFDEFDRQTGKPNETKSFNSTVYVATSFLVDLAELATPQKRFYVHTVAELADIIAAHFIDPSTGWIIENFTRGWRPDWRGWQVQGDATIGITGHNYQAAWLLLRAADFDQIPNEKRTRYREAAKSILSSMLNSKSLDLVNGGVFDAFKREADAPMWHTNKAWWQQAEMILALTKADIAGLFKSHPSLEDKVRDVRDQAVKFYFDHFVDYKNGGEFPVVKITGEPLLNENKGAAGTGTYHQVELARFMREYAQTKRAQSKAEVNAFDSFDMTKAMRAAARGDIAEVQSLVAKGADLMLLNSNGASVLYFAAQATKNSAEIYKYVRTQIGDARFEALLGQLVKTNQHSVSLEAVFNTNIELIHHLLDLRAAGLKVDFSSPTVFGWTPKTFAEREKLAFASLLPDGDVKASERATWLKDQDARWLGSLTPEDRKVQARGADLIAAVEAFNIERTRELILSGVQVNGHYGRLGATPLNSSVRPGLPPAELEMAQAIQDTLIMLGAEPNFAEAGIMMVPSGFREAVFGYESLIRNMLARFTASSRHRLLYLNYQGPINGYTKLIDAALRGRANVIRVLIEAGADRSIQGHNGMTALDAAHLYNRQSTTPLAPEILQLLTP